MALLEVGSPAPDFSGMNLMGGEFALSGVKGTKGIVITFSPDQINPAQVSWAKNLYDKNKADIEMVTVTRKIPSVSMAKAFLQQLGIKFPVVYDQKQDVFRLYGVENPVVIYGIGKDGNIASAAQLDPKQFNQAAVEEAIAKAR